MPYVSSNRSHCGVVSGADEQLISRKVGTCFALLAARLSDDVAANSFPPSCAEERGSGGEPWSTSSTPSPPDLPPQPSPVRGEEAAAVRPRLNAALLSLT